MGRTWLQVDRDYTSGKDRNRVTAAIEALEWHAPTEQGPLSPVLTLQAVAGELGLPKVSFPPPPSPASSRPPGVGQFVGCQPLGPLGWSIGLVWVRPAAALRRGEADE